MRLGEQRQTGMCKRERAPRSLQNRWRRRCRPVFTVLLLDVRSHFLEALAFVHHLHHITRDAYANPSGQAHSIELQISGGRVVLHVA